MVPGTSYTGAVDSSGGPLAIGTSEDKIRIEGTGGEHELTIEEARALRMRLREAINDAEDWAAAQYGDDDE